VVTFLSLPSHGAIVNTFARYRVILDRRPFGEAPAEPVNTGLIVPVKTGPSFIDTLKLKMCAVTRSSLGVRVGFVSTSAKPVKTYYLYVGEEEDGIRVMDASYEDESALLSKDGEEHWLRMQEMDSSRDGSAAAGGGGVAGPDAARRKAREAGRRQRLSPARKKRMELRELRRLASIARREKETAETIKQREQQLRDYNLDCIREGIPALPIPLTEEEDALLVSEGVLAPPPE